MTLVATAEERKITQLVARAARAQDKMDRARAATAAAARERLEAMRDLENLGLSRAEIARRLGVSRQAVTNVLREYRRHRD